MQPLEASDLRQLLRLAMERRDAFLGELAAWVSVDSRTDDVRGVDAMARLFAARLAALGAIVELRRDGAAGQTVVGHFRGAAPGGRILVVGHLDTVGRPSSAGGSGASPLSIEGDSAFGIGAADMKGGLLALVHAMAAIHDLRGSAVPEGELTVVASPDEEVGSPVGGVAVREAATNADAALVLEPGRPDGSVIVARKGMLQGRIIVSGRSSHAGVEPQTGRSALLAAARLIVGVDALSDPLNGVSFSVGTLTGGTRPGVVAADARLELDVRAPSDAGLAAAETSIRDICRRSSGGGLTASFEPFGRFPAMPRTQASDNLLALIVATGARLGVTVRASVTGGASDANTIASMGVPVIDGMGPIGGGMHGPGEYLEVGALPARIALLGGAIGALLHSAVLTVNNPAVPLAREP